MKKNYIEINKESWNSRTDIHWLSEFYDVENFLKGKSSLNEIELQLLGNIEGKKILHLQCHFGQDSISLEKMGAQVTGVDLSDKAILRAKELAIKTNSKAQFICCDLYDLPQHLNGQFDLVFTSYGTITWLPDLDKWGNVISHFLKPSGKFIFVEFHPIVWMFDNDFNHIQYSYFNEGEIVEIEEGTYADKNVELFLESITWNHPISEVLRALLANNLEIISFQEYNYSPYNCFNNTKEVSKGKFIIKNLVQKIPLVYAIEAIKKELE